MKVGGNFVEQVTFKCQWEEIWDHASSDLGTCECNQSVDTLGSRPPIKVCILGTHCTTPEIPPSSHNLKIFGWDGNAVKIGDVSD